MSRLHPASRALAHVEAEADAGRRVRIPSAALTEASFGLSRAAERDPRFAAQRAWFEQLVRGPEVEILPLDRDAGLLAGRLRALQPLPPGAGRADHRSKPDRRVAWLLDLQIAASAWVAGCDVATENRRDFESIAALLGDRLKLSPLGVHESPF